MTMRHALSDACAVANELVSILELGRERLEVAGSVRRERSDVHDVELLCIPSIDGRLDLFGDVAEEIGVLDAYLDALVDDGKLLDKRPKGLGRYMYGPL